MKSEQEIRKLHTTLLNAQVHPEGYDLAVQLIEWVLGMSPTQTDEIVEWAIKRQEYRHKVENQSFNN